tara:strand:+ start:24521 stop:24976 length:456 start_codon:yes stop_codon:yes gene_type:complete
MAKKKPKRRPARRSKVDVNKPPSNPLEAVNPSDVRLKAGKGSAGRGGRVDENYWHIYLDETRVGYVYINIVNEQPFGEHASIQIHINQKHRARGIGSVAYRLACKESEHSVIYAKMRKANVGSQKAASKAGFEVIADAEVLQLSMKWKRRK